MAHLNQFFNSNLTEKLWGETPDEETWNGRMWYGLYLEPEGGEVAGHILVQESDGDGWVQRHSYADHDKLMAVWQRHNP